jgi:hypothetical protein
VKDPDQTFFTRKKIRAKNLVDILVPVQGPVRSRHALSTMRLATDMTMDSRVSANASLVNDVLLFGIAGLVFSSLPGVTQKSATVFSLEILLAFSSLPGLTRQSSVLKFCGLRLSPE